MSSFRYEATGSRIFEGWRDIRDTKKGDCDDYALSVALIYSGGWCGLVKNILLLRVWFWLVKSPSNNILPRHTALWIRGEGWIDSTYPKSFRASLAPHVQIWPTLWPYAFARVALGAWGKFIARIT